ncbi:hypothetical protein CANDROIZ_370003 [Candidatus Roizmanbacteria bacterium]|nr:hypothetical protein CANDROIZ_370003 [Candidatus Roizmanbacteria bacterium]
MPDRFTRRSLDVGGREDNQSSKQRSADRLREAGMPERLARASGV